MSGCTKTLPNSVRTIEPVGHDSRHPAFPQCRQTSDENSHVTCSLALPPPPARASRSTNFTWRYVECPRARVLSYDSPLQTKPSSGTSFHSLQATSHALHPMQSVESVRKPVTAMTGELSAFEKTSNTSRMREARHALNAPGTTPNEETLVRRP